MTIPTILTLADAQAHLRIDAGNEEMDLELKLAAATQLVCEYIVDRQPEDEDWIAEIEAWTPQSAPPAIKAAVLTQLGELYRFRGDDMATDRPPVLERGYLSPAVSSYLHRYRSPSLA